MNVIHNNDSKSPVLQTVIIEPILISCINKVSFYVLAFSDRKNNANLYYRDKEIFVLSC